MSRHPRRPFDSHRLSPQELSSCLAQLNPPVWTAFIASYRVSQRESQASAEHQRALLDIKSDIKSLQDAFSQRLKDATERDSKRSCSQCQGGARSSMSASASAAQHECARPDALSLLEQPALPDPLAPHLNPPVMRGSSDAMPANGASAQQPPAQQQQQPTPPPPRQLPSPTSHAALQGGAGGGSGSPSAAATGAGAARAALPVPLSIATSPPAAAAAPAASCGAPIPRGPGTGGGEAAAAAGAAGSSLSQARPASAGETPAAASAALAEEEAEEDAVVVHSSSSRKKRGEQAPPPPSDAGPGDGCAPPLDSQLLSQQLRQRAAAPQAQPPETARKRLRLAAEVEAAAPAPATSAQQEEGGALGTQAGAEGKEGEEEGMYRDGHYDEVEGEGAAHDSDEGEGEEGGRKPPRPHERTAVYVDHTPGTPEPSEPTALAATALAASALKRRVRAAATPAAAAAGEAGEGEGGSAGPGARQQQQGGRSDEENRILGQGPQGLSATASSSGVLPKRREIPGGPQRQPPAAAAAGQGASSTPTAPRRSSSYSQPPLPGSPSQPLLSIQSTAFESTAAAAAGGRQRPRIWGVSAAAAAAAAPPAHPRGLTAVVSRAMEQEEPGDKGNGPGPAPITGPPLMVVDASESAVVQQQQRRGRKTPRGAARSRGRVAVVAGAGAAAAPTAFATPAPLAKPTGGSGGSSDKSRGHSGGRQESGGEAPRSRPRARPSSASSAAAVAVGASGARPQGPGHERGLPPLGPPPPPPPNPVLPPQMPPPPPRPPASVPRQKQRVGDWGGGGVQGQQVQAPSATGPSPPPAPSPGPPNSHWDEVDPPLAPSQLARLLHPSAEEPFGSIDSLRAHPQPALLNEGTGTLGSGGPGTRRERREALDAALRAEREGMRLDGPPALLQRRPQTGAAPASAAAAAGTGSGGKAAAPGGGGMVAAPASGRKSHKKRVHEDTSGSVIGTSTKPQDAAAAAGDALGGQGGQTMIASEAKRVRFNASGPRSSGEAAPAPAAPLARMQPLPFADTRGEGGRTHGGAPTGDALIAAAAGEGGGDSGESQPVVAPLRVSSAMRHAATAGGTSAGRAAHRDGNGPTSSDTMAVDSEPQPVLPIPQAPLRGNGNSADAAPGPLPPVEEGETAPTPAPAVPGTSAPLPRPSGSPGAPQQSAPAPPDPDPLPAPSGSPGCSGGLSEDSEGFVRLRFSPEEGQQRAGQQRGRVPHHPGARGSDAFGAALEGEGPHSSSSASGGPGPHNEADYDDLDGIDALFQGNSFSAHVSQAQWTSGAAAGAPAAPRPGPPASGSAGNGGSRPSAPAPSAAPSSSGGGGDEAMFSQGALDFRGGAALDPQREVENYLRTYYREEYGESGAAAAAKDGAATAGAPLGQLQLQHSDTGVGAPGFGAPPLLLPGVPVHPPLGAAADSMGSGGSPTGTAAVGAVGSPLPLLPAATGGVPGAWGQEPHLHGGGDTPQQHPVAGSPQQQQQLMQRQMQRQGQQQMQRLLPLGPGQGSFRAPPPHPAPHFRLPNGSPAISGASAAALGTAAGTLWAFKKAQVQEQRAGAADPFTRDASQSVIPLRQPSIPRSQPPIKHAPPLRGGSGAPVPQGWDFEAPQGSSSSRAQGGSTATPGGLGHLAAAASTVVVLGDGASGAVGRAPPAPSAPQFRLPSATPVPAAQAAAPAPQPQAARAQRPQKPSTLPQKPGSLLDLLEDS